MSFFLVNKLTKTKIDNIYAGGDVYSETAPVYKDIDIVEVDILYSSPSE